MSKEEIFSKMKQAATLVMTLKESILKMCDNMDSTNDLTEKEVIRQAILITESQMEEAEMVYNELLEEIRQ